MNIRFSALASVGALCCFTLPAVHAADAQLGHVVVTATRQPVSADAALASVDVIERDEIARAGHSSLLGLLASRPGVQMARNGGPGSSGSVYIRGANAGHTLLLVDGVRIGSATSGSPVLETIPLEIVERIEILRGPGSALYGADALGGVIQVFTRKGKEGFHPSARVGAGSDGAREASATLAGGAGVLRYSVTAGHERSDGFNARTPVLSVNDRDDDGFREDYLSASLALDLGGNDEIGANVLYSDMRNWYDAAQPFDSHLDKRAESYGMYLRKQHSSDWVSTLRFGHGVDALENQSNAGARSRFDTTQRQLSWQHDIALGGGSLMAAYEFLQQRVQTTTHYERTRRHMNAFLLGWGGEFDRHRVQLNARHDRNSQFGSKTTGTAAYGYEITPEWRVHASIGNAFKAPTFNDLYYPVECYPMWGCFGGNPALKPEEALNREIGVAWERNDLSMGLTYFNNRIRNLIDWSSGVAANVGRADIEGVEASLGAMLGKYRVRASVDLLDAEDRQTGDELGRRARISGALALERLAGAWTWGVEWNGKGQRYDRVPNAPAGRLGGYGLVDAYVHYAVAPDWSVEVRANNLLDKDYELAKGYGTQGRSVFVALRYAMH
ncbi:MAG: TonB-dependent receptor [Thauera sp.]|jgi:vitamin B12 transporter|nr:TonB-dependent receptor [Thauera sp.]